MKRIRQPIVTVAGHVDHGKTSILDFFRGTSVQEREGGGITQKISYTKFPLKHIKNACHLIDEQGIKIDIPGFLFIDTPGHAAFTSLRKRGGSLSDLVILVVSIKEGIKPQTMEVLQILKKYKIPFLIALNKIDTIFGKRQDFKSLRETIENSSIHVYQEFKEALLTFQCSLAEHGFDSDLFYDINDFGKKIAIVPCSAKTGEGISELLFVLTGLCQKFLLDKLELSEEVRGVVLEVKKDKGMDYIEVILSDGCLEIGDEIAIAGFNGIITSKIRALEEIEPLCFDYCNVKKISASSGARIHFTNKERILPGMPFRRIDGNLDKLKNEFKEDLSSVVNLDKEGIIVKADSLGSLGALLFLLKTKELKLLKLELDI